MAWIDNVLAGDIVVGLRPIADFLVNGITSGTITSGDIHKGLEAIFQRLPAEAKQTGFFYNGYIFSPAFIQTHFPGVGGVPYLFPEERPSMYVVFKWQNPNNYTATSPPTNTDDSAKGYSLGSMWIDQSTKHIYICVQDTLNNALWQKIG